MPPARERPYFISAETSEENDSGERVSMSCDPYGETASTWNGWAERYEQRFMDATLYQASYDRLLAELQPTAEVLEVGCGPGNLTLALLRRQPGLKITGLDVAPAMLERARLHCPGATFFCADARQLDCLGGVFDAVVVGFCIPYLKTEDVQTFLSACQRKLRPGGCLYLSYVEGDPEQAGFHSGSGGERVFFCFHRRSQVVGWLEDLGFELKAEFAILEPDGKLEFARHTVLIAQMKGRAPNHHDSGQGGLQ